MLVPPVTVPNTILGDGMTIVSKDGNLICPDSSPCTWYKVGNSNTVDTVTLQKINQLGQYYMTGIDLNGCMATSDTIDITSLTYTEAYFHNATFLFPGIRIDSHPKC